MPLARCAAVASLTTVLADGTMVHKVREAIRLVAQDGWYQVRTRGSHRHFRHPTKPGTVTIHGHPGEDVRVGTWKSIMRQAGLDEEE